jgi:hypothetical protein
MKLPETTTDQILLYFTLLTASFSAAIIIMGYQERKAPPEFKEIALFIGGGVFGALSAKRLSG